MLLDLSTSTIWFVRFKRRMLTAAAMALIAGCASGPRPVMPVPLNVSVRADAKINPDAKGRPSPLKVVFYELKSGAAFEAADFFSLSQKDQATIGTDLLGREEFFLRPGDSKTLVRKGYPDTAVIGVFAEFRDIDKSVWRATTAVPVAEPAGMLSSLRATKEKSYQILLDQRSVKIIPLAAPGNQVSLPELPSLPAKPALPEGWGNSR